MTFWNFQRANRRRCLAALSLLFGFFFLVWWGLFEIVRLFFPFPFSLPYLFFVVGAFFPILFLLRRSEGAIREFIDAIGALPLDKEDLRHRRVENIVREISLSAGVTPPQVYIFPSPLKNAFSIKTEEGGTLVLSEGLAGNLRRDEIQGVVAHEIGHLVEGDTEYKTFLATLSAGFLSTRRLLGFSSSSQEGTEKGIGLPLQGGRFGLFAITVVLYLLVASLVARLLSLLVSRQREYLADLKALELTRNPEALARALCVVGRDRLRALVPLTHPSFAMLFFVNPAWRVWEEGSGLLAELFSTHPPLSERIRRLLRIAGVPVGLFYTQTMRHRAEIPPEDELYTKGR
ncbi:MAG TPA: M48 family metalloprotease, partial [Candidatus Aminicenantes bacterium]|nr:M48 family metalloprotease [Candidatus Aminicenantes bacterium]